MNIQSRQDCRTLNRAAAPARVAVSLMAVLLLFICAAVGGKAREETISFITTQRSLQPGEVVLIEALSSLPLKSLKVEAFDLEFPAFGEKDGRTWRALVGIDLSTGPGLYEIRLKGIGADGATVIRMKTLTVSSKDFLTRELTVEPKYVTPPAEVLDRIADERKRVNSIFASTTPSRIWNGSFIYPVDGIVTSPFGSRNVYNGVPRNPHTGVDLRGGVGTPIKAPNAGKIVLVDDLYYSGNTIIIDHGMGLYSYFAHLSEFSVKEGATVRKGDLVGKVGATGRVTGPHLHWTVRLARSLVDPLSLISVLDDSAVTP
jgi:murein DD-endopeptidase MepM/ murein hydrolase activator NlpD